MKTNSLERPACRVIKVPKQSLSTEPTVLPALAGRWQAATGHHSRLLTTQALLLISGMRRAKRKESFRLKEARRDADGEGDRRFGLQLLLGCEVGEQDTLEQAQMTAGQSKGHLEPMWDRGTSLAGTEPGEAV